MLARLRKRLTNWNLESTLRPFRVPTVVKIDFFPSGFECLRVSVVLRSFSIDNYFHFSMYREMSCRAKIWACWGRFLGSPARNTPGWSKKKARALNRGAEKKKKPGRSLFPGAKKKAWTTHIMTYVRRLSGGPL
jgi:hypothetical protein